MRILNLLLIVIVCFALFSASEETKPKYQCMPCGLDCDTIVVDAAGECSKCRMKLVTSNSITFKSIKPASICG